MSKDKIKLTEILCDLDFDYIINDDNTLSLRDLQDANLANIESESFKIDKNIAILLIDRLDNYIYDYYINGYIDTLRHECQEDIKGSNFDDILAKMEQHSDMFLGCVELMKSFVNPNLFDISDILNYKKED